MADKMKKTIHIMLAAAMATTFAQAQTDAAPKKMFGTAALATPDSADRDDFASLRCLADFEDDGFFANWIENRLSVGLAFSKFSLENGTRPPNREEDFLGNINKLKNSHASRVFPVVEYKVCDYLSVGASYMHIEASTLNFNNGEGDGNAVMKGPTLSAELTYPLFDDLLIPHVGGGFAFLSGDFEEDTWWRLGYSSPESWKYLGKSSHRRGNHYRYIDVDDATKAYFEVGVSCKPHPRLKLDISYRKISLDPDCEFGYEYGDNGGIKDKHSEGDFDLGGYFWMFSASYIF